MLFFREADSTLARAFRGHALVAPFNRPGQVDLTANVDISEEMVGTGASGPS